MPRLAKNERDRQMDAIARRIRHHYSDILKERGLDCRTAANSMGVPYDRLNNRMKSPSAFTLGELYAIANAMNISLSTLVSGKEELS